MSLIGISGKIGSGKDTVGDIIRLLTRNIKDEDFDTSSWDIKNVINPFGWNPNHDTRIYKFETKKFANKLKDIVCLLIGCTREQLEDRDFKEKELGEEWNKWKVNILFSNKYFNSKEEALEYIKNSHPQKQFTSTQSIKPELIKLTPRLLLQLLGTDCGRDIIHPNIWVNSLIREYKERKPNKGDSFDYFHTECIDCKKKFTGSKRQFICNDCYDTHDWFPNWIVTDMRFPNEMKAIKDKGGITIRVNRPAYLQNNKAGILEPVHESETALDDAKFDYVIDNNGSIEELIEKVKKILIKENLL